MSAKIEIRQKSPDIYEVEVRAGTKTVHEVTVSSAYYQKLTKGKKSPEELLRESFEFLLLRESNTMILRRFELSVIGTYFPEYESKITTH